MTRTFVFLLLLCTMFIDNIKSSEFENHGRQQFETFKLEHAKQYYNEVEELFRYNIFIDNLRTILKHNVEYRKNESSFEMGINQYSDMQLNEIVTDRNEYFGNKASEDVNKNGIAYRSPLNVALPSSINWCANGAVTSVKNQGYKCGACWAFAATGALEGQIYLTKGYLISLSEQNLVDCSTGFGNNGCQYGNPSRAFQYIKSNGGIDTENSYPYNGREQSCRLSKKSIGATVRGFVRLPTDDESKLKEAVATIGPIAVFIDLPESFKHYSKGVFYDRDCSSSDVNHVVLVVGYGTENSVDYWLVKNSWGAKWGAEGYVKMARNKNNNCGIAKECSYPLV